MPQFIEVEDKIFGPFSFRQFVYMGGGIGSVVVLYFVGGFFAAVLIGMPIFGVGLALAFLKINNRPLIYAAQSAFFYFTRKKLFLWKREEHVKKHEAAPTQEQSTTAKPFVPQLSESKLKDLAWSLDVKDSLYADEEQIR